MNDKISGIYAIFRKCDDKCMYIGQSANCDYRIYHHFCGNTHTPIENKAYYYADIIEKHGFDNKEFRLTREAFWINIFEPEWNIDKNRTRSEETKQKISKANSGRIHSEESKQKNREAHLGDKNAAKRPEVRQKISKLFLGKHWKLVDGKRVWY